MSNTGLAATPILRLDGIAKAYRGTPVLIDLDLEAAPGELTVVYGPPASGKSVLVRILTGLEHPDAGRITLRGQDITAEAPAERNIGYVPQSFALYPHLSVRANIAYPQALANSYAGTDLNAATPDIQATFNISLDTGTCLNGTVGWWYNTDPSVTVPNDRTPLLPVVFHEIGHGLGFSAGVNTTTGAFTTGSTPSIWATYLYDVETGKYWRNMTNTERQA